jgi:two-component system response regulator FixJ
MLRETIFVVDDDEAVRDSMALLLAASGFTVQTFATGAEFLTAHDVDAGRCAIVDVHMPDIDGFAVVEALHARKLEMSVVLITGRSDAAVEARARTLGVHPVLQKPLRKGMLIQTLRQALSSTKKD